MGMCSATTAVAKLSNAPQGTDVVATCAWPQATFAARMWRATTFLARAREASAVETPAQHRAANAADRRRWRGVGGILPASAPSALSDFWFAMLHKVNLLTHVFGSA